MPCKDLVVRLWHLSVTVQPFKINLVLLLCQGFEIGRKTCPLVIMAYDKRPTLSNYY
jgi:hypothetical protein